MSKSVHSRELSVSIVQSRRGRLGRPPSIRQRAGRDNGRRQRWRLSPLSQDSAVAWPTWWVVRSYHDADRKNGTSPLRQMERFLQLVKFKQASVARYLCSVEFELEFAIEWNTKCRFSPVTHWMPPSNGWKRLNHRRNMHNSCHQEYSIRGIRGYGACYSPPIKMHRPPKPASVQWAAGRRRASSRLEGSIPG